MYRYKIYFYDRDINSEYPVTIEKKDICDLCKWLNKHTTRWNLEVVYAQLLDDNLNVKGQVALLQEELDIQHFITSLPTRLIAYHEFISGGV
jgi:hypothetical protein